MSVYFKREETQLIVVGKTFPVKEKIRGLGGRWDPVRGVWTLPLDLDTDEARIHVGALTKADEARPATERMANTRAAAEAMKEERQAKVAKKEEKRRANAAAKNLELVKWCLADTSGKYSWVCCEKCEILDLKKGHISCRAHAHWDGQSWCSFRIFGSLYTGN
jgi:hypothetical protein